MLAGAEIDTLSWRPAMTTAPLAGASVSELVGQLAEGADLAIPDALPTPTFDPTVLAQFASSIPQEQLQQLAQMFATQQQQQQQQQLQHKKQFLNGLASVHHARKDPLPPILTGIPYPVGFDPAQSRWKSLEASQTEVGSVMLAGKPVDLYKLWAAVNAGGGWAKVSIVLFA